MERLEFLNGNLKGVSQVLLVRLTRTQPISSWGKPLWKREAEFETEGHFGTCGACLGAVLGGLGGYLCGGKTPWVTAGIGAVCGGMIGYKIGKNIKVNLEDTTEFCP